MIKRANQKKKKGFSLIELIIVLAVMAIIALIAIPNFTAVRESSKIKADVQSGEALSRSIETLVADDSIKGTGTIKVYTDATSKTITVNMTNTITVDPKVFTATSTVESYIAALMKDQSIPQENGKNTYVVTITDSGEGLNRTTKVETKTEKLTTAPSQTINGGTKTT